MAPLVLAEGPYQWEIWLWVSATPGDGRWDHYPAWSAERLRTAGRDLNRITDLVADLATALGPRGWEARLIADSGEISAFVRKTASTADVYAELRGLSGSLYRRIADGVLILAEQPEGDEDILELRITDRGFERYSPGP